MAISVDWAGTDANPYRIFVPKADTTLIQASPEVRELDADVFRKALKDLEADTEGMPWPDTHRHTGESTLAGVTYGRSVEVLSPYSVEFEDGQYGVSVVGANTNLLDVKLANQVSLLGNNSAGLVNLNAILATLNYQASVWLSAANGAPGTIEGVNGIPSNPVDSVADARTLMSTLGLRTLRILDGSFTLTTALEQSEVVMGAGASLDLGGQSVDASTITGGKVTGAQGGSGKAAYAEAELENVTGIRCQARDCGLAGTITLGTGKAEFYKCHSDIVGTSTPVLDFVGAGRSVGLRQYSGGLELRNVADVTNVASLDYVSGQLIFDASCTGGQVVYRGIIGPVTDNSAGTSLVNAGHLDPNDVRLMAVIRGVGLKTGENLVFTNPVAGGAAGTQTYSAGGLVLTVSEAIDGTITITRTT